MLFFSFFFFHFFHGTHLAQGMLLLQQLGLLDDVLQLDAVAHQQTDLNVHLIEVVLELQKHQARIKKK